MSKMKDKAIEQDNNMKIWDQVAKTDVDHTKQVSFGRKFTAIDAHSQVMEATKQFGPVGQGWGYDNEYGEIHFTDGRVLAYCDVRFWWAPVGEWEGNKTHDPKKHFGPVRGAAMLVSTNKDGSLKLPDTDAYKKASTDGLTKLLSHLGFNADVFLGQFDDNKYVEELKKEKQIAQTADQRAYQEDRNKFVKKIKGCTQPEQIDKVMENHKIWLAGLPVVTATEIRSWVMKQQTEMKDGSK